MGKSDQNEDKLGASVGFIGYFVLNFIGAAAVSALVMEVFSSMGIGEQTLDALKDLSSASMYCFGALFCILLVLYQLDFFWPPHIPGQYCVLWQGGAVVGGIIVGILSTIAVAGCFFMAGDYPWIPFLLTTFVTPLLILGIRLATRPRFNRVDCARLERLLAQGGEVAPEMQVMKSRQELMEVLEAQEGERRVYYQAVQMALSLVSLGTFIVWLLWAMSNDVTDSSTTDDNEEAFILWVAPLVLSVAYLSFTLVIGFRLALGSMYAKTEDMPRRLDDKLRLELNPSRASNSGLRRASGLFQKTGSIGSQEKLQEQKSKVRRSLQQSLGASEFNSLSVHDQKEMVDKHVVLLAQLRLIIMALGCTIFALLAANYVVYQLVTDNKNVLLMLQAYLSLLLIFCIIFTYTSFRRVWHTMGGWVADMPLFKMSKALSKSDWVRALGTFMCAIFVPLLCAVSMLNQCIRSCRGVDCKRGSKMSPGTDAQLLMEDNAALPDEQQPAAKRCRLTPRVGYVVTAVDTWDWLSVIKKTYIVAIAVVVLILTPLLLNVFLAWMYKVLADQEMALIIAAVFACGLILFLLPPVPGAPVYLFGGVLISGKGEDIGGMTGYWLWSVICIFICWILKLVACAVQQKGIGGLLGSKLWVRQTVGVHKPFIRAIEVVLRRPGLSFGKCMILMGGPDWPTSVLAGVLKLSLLQCEIGTMPIISYIAPLSLTGSFYLKRDAGQTWKNAGDLMFSLTALMTLIYWVSIGWVIQGVLDQEHEMLTQPREEYIDLDWLDYRDAQIAGICVFTMSDLPLWVKLPFITGCAGCILLGQAVYWMPTVFFGTFAVTGDVDELEVYGDDGLITLLGAIALGAVALCACGYYFYSCWHRSKSRVLRREAEQRLLSVEEEWKAARRQEAREAAAKSRIDCEEVLESGSITSGLSVHHPPMVEESPFGPCSYTANTGILNNRTTPDDADLQGEPATNAAPRRGKLKPGKTMPAGDALGGDGAEVRKSISDADGGRRKGPKIRAKRAATQEVLAEGNEGVARLPRGRTKKLAAKDQDASGNTAEVSNKLEHGSTESLEEGSTVPAAGRKKVLLKSTSMPADAPSGKSRQRGAQNPRTEVDVGTGNLARSADSTSQLEPKEKAIKPTVVGRISEDAEEDGAGAAERADVHPNGTSPQSADSDAKQAKGDKAATRKKLRVRKRQESKDLANPQTAADVQLEDGCPADSDRD